MRTLGSTGERLATRFLRRRGYDVLGVGYRAMGCEVDVIARDPRGDTVFVEVKTRQSEAAGHPEDAVTDQKREHIVRAARVWLSEHRLMHAPWRVDVIAIRMRASPEIVHFEGV